MEKKTCATAPIKKNASRNVEYNERNEFSNKWKNHFNNDSANYTNYKYQK